LTNPTLLGRSTRQEVAPGNTLHFSDAPLSIIPSGPKKIAFHLHMFSIDADFGESAIAVRHIFFQVQPRQKNNISLRPIAFCLSFFAHVEFHRPA